MTAEDVHLAAVAALGYTSREAAFLVRVARHSGYFVRRQFLAWIGRDKGQTVVDFTDRLVARRHATVHTFCRTTRVYHLSARSLYGEGIEGTVSQRRRRPVVSIKARLMALDVVMARPGVTFLASEVERVAFCDALMIDRARLPQQCWRSKARQEGTRYFPDSLLLGVQYDPSGPVLLCIYLDDGQQSVAGFQTFLRRYARLLAVVPRWRVVHVSERTPSAASATAVVRQAFGHDLAHGCAVDDVREYFHLRHAYEAQRWADLDTRRLDRFRVLRRRFGTTVDPWYARWEREGDRALQEGLAGAEPAQSLRLETMVLPASYAAIESRTRRS